MDSIVQSLYSILQSLDPMVPTLLQKALDPYNFPKSCNEVITVSNFYYFPNASLNLIALHTLGLSYSQYNMPIISSYISLNALHLSQSSINPLGASVY